MGMAAQHMTGSVMRLPTNSGHKCGACVHFVDNSRLCLMGFSAHAKKIACTVGRRKEVAS